MLQQDEMARIEDLLDYFHKISARHRFDTGMNVELKIKLTPKDSPPYSQHQPTPINLIEDILVELAPLHSYGMTTLPFTNYASPIFAQKEHNGKLRLLVDLRKINNLVLDDYIKNQSPRQYVDRCCTTYGIQKALLQFGLLSSIPLLAEGGPKVHRDVGVQHCKPNIRLSEFGSGPQQSAVVLFELYERIFDRVVKADTCSSMSMTLV